MNHALEQLLRDSTPDRLPEGDHRDALRIRLAEERSMLQRGVAPWSLSQYAAAMVCTSVLVAIALFASVSSPRLAPGDDAWAQRLTRGPSPAFAAVPAPEPPRLTLAEAEARGIEARTELAMAGLISPAPLTR